MSRKPSQKRGNELAHCPGEGYKNGSSLNPMFVFLTVHKCQLEPNWRTLFVVIIFFSGDSFTHGSLRANTIAKLSNMWLRSNNFAVNHLSLSQMFATSKDIWIKHFRKGIELGILFQNLENSITFVFAYSELRTNN